MTAWAQLTVTAWPVAGDQWPDTSGQKLITLPSITCPPGSLLLLITYHYHSSPPPPPHSSSPSPPPPPSLPVGGALTLLGRCHVCGGGQQQTGSAAATARDCQGARCTTATTACTWCCQTGARCQGQGQGQGQGQPPWTPARCCGHWPGYLGERTDGPLLATHYFPGGGKQPPT